MATAVAMAVVTAVETVVVAAVATAVETAEAIRQIGGPDEVVVRPGRG